jgi:hypothetical protein
MGDGALLVVQVQLQSGTTVRTCWLSPRVRPGDRVTLKNSEDPERWWTVLTVTTPFPADGLHRDWHAGGL